MLNIYVARGSMLVSIGLFVLGGRRGILYVSVSSCRYAMTCVSWYIRKYGASFLYQFWSSRMMMVIFCSFSCAASLAQSIAC
jgi:hypothetical protein